MQKTLKEITQLVNGKLVGDGSVVITGLSGIKEAKKGDLTFLANIKYVPNLKETKASAVIVGEDVSSSGHNLIVVDNPSLAFSKVANLFVDQASEKIKGIHPSAITSKDVKLGKNVAVGPLVVIDAGVKIGNGTVINAGSFIGAESVIGNNSYIYPNVTILNRSLIGSNVIIHSGTVIGSDGFGYEFVGGIHQKIPQIGYVEIADDVEIGSNTSIDRARFDKTYIGKGTKVDNLVQIAHNVVIEENCIIVAFVGISGSTRIEKNSIIAGQVGIAGHLTVGAGSVVAAQSGITKSFPAGSKIFGSPAVPMNEAKRSYAALARLPHYVEMISKLTKRIEDLEKKIKK